MRTIVFCAAMLVLWHGSNLQAAECDKHRGTEEPACADPEPGQRSGPTAPPQAPASVLTPDAARDAITFLGRTDIKGAEAPRFLDIVRQLKAAAEAGK